MDASQLEAFVAIVEVGSFTRAAARLGVSQPTVTNRIKALERALGASLLERLPGGVEPTAAGTQLLPYARDIVGLSARARAAVQSSGEPRGRIELGSIESLTTGRLLPLIEYLYVRYPKIQFSLRTFVGADAVTQVRNGRLDCAFFVDTEQEYGDLQTRILCPEPLVLVAGPDHSLLKRSSVTPEDLLNSTFVQSEVPGGYHARFQNVIARGLSRTLRLDSIDATKRSVANGVGVTLLPEVAVAREIEAGTLRRIAWTPPDPTFTQVAWRRRRGHHPALAAVIAAATRVVQEQVAVSGAR